MNLTFFKSRQKGASLIEFAIVLPFFLIVGIGATEIGNTLLQYNALTKSVRDSSRFLSRNISTTICDTKIAKGIIKSSVKPNGAITDSNINFTFKCVSAGGVIKNATNIAPLPENCNDISEFEMENYCSAAGGKLHIQVDASYIYSQTFWGGYDNIFYTPTLTATSIMKIP